VATVDVSMFLEGWVAKLRGWITKLVARPLAKQQHSEFEFRHPSKIINGRHKQRSGQQTLARQKHIQKMFHISSHYWNIYLMKVTDRRISNKRTGSGTLGL
jgi:hypothetical protein